MKNKKVSKLLAMSALTGMVLTTTGCNVQDIVDDFNPINNIPMPAYGMYENFDYANSNESEHDEVVDNITSDMNDINNQSYT